MKKSTPVQKKYGTIKDPIVVINKSLDNRPIPEFAIKKLKEANETLARIGLPKGLDPKKYAPKKKASKRY